MPDRRDIVERIAAELGQVPLVEKQNRVSFSVDDARRYLLALLPPGAEDFYDLTPGIGDVYQLFDAFGATFKQFVFDVIDTLRSEIFPSSSVQKLPDWEAALGISNLAPAVFGTTAQRQQAVLAKLREQGGSFCDPLVQAVLQPLLGYNPSTPLQILKCSRAALDLVHSYQGGALFGTRNATTTSNAIKTTDGGVISNAGVRLYLTLAAPLPAGVTFTLTGPDGFAVSWAPTADGATTTYQFFGAAFAGRQLQHSRLGWSLTIANTSLTTDASVTTWKFIVEGIGPKQDTGGAIFHWGVYADPAHLGENGVTADLGSARFAMTRIEHSEADYGLILALSSNPDDPGAIPDTFLPA